ncbi:tyrosine-type recombinase/integrase [Nonomuraea sp. H19]|uniref:tyrosine-type recombinase/integrase n=1 Tax=Nonomuraea sp. H19 TaxID=3452206 RepID=UPI003F89F2CF
MGSAHCAHGAFDLLARIRRCPAGAVQVPVEVVHGRRHGCVPADHCGYSRRGISGVRAVRACADVLVALSGGHLPIDRVGAMMAACNADLDRGDVEDLRKRDELRRVALRDAALYSTGVRRFELAGMALADYDPSARSLRIRGKRSKERMVYLTASAVGRIEAWLTVRRRDPGRLVRAVHPARQAHPPKPARPNRVHRRADGQQRARRPCTPVPMP